MMPRRCGSRGARAGRARAGCGPGCRPAPRSARPSRRRGRPAAALLRNTPSRSNRPKKSPDELGERGRISPARNGSTPSSRSEPRRPASATSSSSAGLATSTPGVSRASRRAAPGSRCARAAHDHVGLADEAARGLAELGERAGVDEPDRRGERDADGDREQVTIAAAARERQAAERRLARPRRRHAASARAMRRAGTRPVGRRARGCGPPSRRRRANA